MVFSFYFCKTFKSTFLTKHLLMTASVNAKPSHLRESIFLQMSHNCLTIIWRQGRNHLIIKEAATWGVLWWWWWLLFVVWLTDERRLALFPSVTTVRDPHHRESPTRLVWTCAEPEFSLSWMKLCSSDNHYTTTPHAASGLPLY